MRYKGPKVRIARKFGVEFGLKTPGTKSYERMIRRLNIRPGQHGRKRRRLTEYGLQLLEKQKLKYMFGINERQLRNYFEKAVAKKGNTALFLCQMLEKRLDNIVYRLGFAPTRAAARQLVSHNHIKVNDRVVNIASYQVKIGDKITFKSEKSMNIPYVKKMLEEKVILPKWLKRKGNVGELVEEPTEEEISKIVDLRMLIDFYSR